MTDESPSAQPPQGTVLDRLKAREDQRLEDAAQRHDQSQDIGGSGESVQTFLDDFSKHKAQLDLRIQNYASDAASNETKTSEAQVLSSELSDLEQRVAAAAYYLPAYDLRQVTLAVGALKQALEAASKSKQPRKKFSFARKATITAAPSAAAAASDLVAATAALELKQERPAAAGQLKASGKRIADLSKETIVLTNNDITEDEDVTLCDLQGCTVFLLCPLGALFMHRLVDCVVVTGPVGGATHVEDLKGCRLYIAARQVRIHSSLNCEFYMCVRSGPIIEHSQSLAFAPYVPCYPGAEEHLAVQGLERDGGEWQNVQDFGWLRSTASPHWRVLEEEERKPPPSGAMA